MINMKCISAFLLMLISGAVSGGQLNFGAYYTSLDKGQAWESRSRTGQFADLTVKISNAGGSLVFWRGNSYLPYWKTGKGQWNLPVIVLRSGDGTEVMPDKANVYSHVEIIKNTPLSVVIHWRYLASFKPGNPNGGLSPDNFVDELFTITQDERVARVVKKGTAAIDDWKDPLNQVTQVLQLNATGVFQVSRSSARHTTVKSRLEGNPLKGPSKVTPALWFKFDEGTGNLAHESITGTSTLVPGDKTLWKRGISGTALEFDGYHTSVSIPADKAPVVSGGSLTLEAWFALGAYP